MGTQEVNSITVLKRDLNAVIEQINKSGSVLLLKNNKPCFYAVSPLEYERLLRGAKSGK